MTDTQLAKQIAQTILDGFDRHFQIFSDITRAAKTRFENADWEGDNRAREERISYYDVRVREALFELNQNYTFDNFDTRLWRQVKLQFMGLLYAHTQPELAESFYNSVFCRLFDRSYYHNTHIFVRPGLATDAIDMDAPAYSSYYPEDAGMDACVTDFLGRLDFSLPWQNLERDIGFLSQDLDCQLAPTPGATRCQVQLINAPFFRNKAAYLVGRTISDGQLQGFLIPILRSDEGEMYVDTLITDADDLAIVFSFTRAYFMVDTEVPSAVIDFLSSILPSKTRSDLYSAIGFQKQGKTLFYRDFLNHLAHSSDQLITAPGIEGMVMSVFTLPSFPYVFKVIKDRFAPPKEVDRQTVIDKYQYVKNHDRVGRMADTLEFSHVALPLERIAPDLLEKLQHDIADSIAIENDDLIINHLYIERRMIPLNLYIESASDDELEHAIKDYGQAIKEMIRANVFPGDMLIKNFGVTRQRRVVFYDYDEIQPMKTVNIRRIPPARTPEQEMASEPWYRIDEDDFFPEQFENFVMSHPKVRPLFLKHHPDLLDPAYWQTVLDHINQGIRADIFPYSQAIRYRNRIAA